MKLDLYRLKKLLFYIPDAIQSRFNPTAYAQRKGVKMKGRVHFYGKPKIGTEPFLITVGDNVHITNNVQFITHDGGTLLFRKKIKDLEITKPISIGDNVYIGVNTILLPGITIGDNVIVGAGSIVTKSLPANGVYAGVPAKFIKPIDAYFEKIQEESLHLGHLSAYKKEKALKEYFNYK